MAKLNKKDMILILVLAVLIGGGFLAKNIFFGADGAKGIVQQNGELIAELDLQKETELQLDDGLGGTNTVKVKDGMIFVSDANCPDQICVYSNPISHTGEVVACLPHGLLLTVKEPGGEALDASAW